MRSNGWYLLFAAAIVISISRVGIEISNATVMVDQADGIQWKRDVAPILKQKCVTCHSQFEDYNSVYLKALMIRQRVQQGTMPPKSALQLTETEIYLISAWVAQGAKK